MESNMERKQLLAREGTEGTFYFTELGKKVKIVKIHRFGGAPEDVSSVSVMSEGWANLVTISGGTILYEDQKIQNQNIETKQETKKMARTTSKTPPLKEETVKEKTLKMSHIMNPMIFAGKPAEEIADAVIASFPNQVDRRDKLIQLIKGPRTWNLKKKHPEKFQSLQPAVVQQDPAVSVPA